MPKPSLITRAIAAGKLLAGQRVDQSDWFGPSEPLPPMAPREVEGRRFDLQPGYNLVTNPRGAERIDFRALRALADNYDLMRLAIETRKDQLAKLTGAVRAKDPGQRGAHDPRVASVNDFLAYPDREHSWETWLRALVEDMLVIDAATIYPRKNRGGQLYALDLIDGATIKPVIDDHGRRPLPPLPAYQQVLVGLPAVDYAATELFYFPRNYRTAHVYGFPPVEQAIMSINIALRRQMHQLQFYTDGTMPDAIVPVPDNWSPQQIEDFQAYFDSLMVDNTAERRRMRFVPAGVAKGIVFPKDGALKDEYDEWLARIICYAFSVSPQWAVKQMNRASADSAQDQALQEGLAPLQHWVKLVIDRCIADGFGYPDLEFAWDSEDSVDPKEQSDLLLAQLAKGAIVLDEFRAATGREPYANGIGSKPMIFTAGGAVLLETIVAPPPTPDPAQNPPHPTLSSQWEEREGPAQREGEEGGAIDPTTPPSPQE
jgi:hypothetical protein